MIREGKSIRWLITMVIGLLLLCSGPMSIVSAEEAAATDVTIKVNGELVKMTDSVYIVEGRTYVPVARIAQMFGAKLSWDNANEELTIHTALNDKIVFGNGVPTIYLNDTRYRMDAFPFMSNGRLFVPLRQLAELLDASLKVNTGADVIELLSVQSALAAEVHVMDESSKSNVQSALFKEVKPYTDSDLMLLAKITMVEAGYESYQGQLAIANVVLNRVKDTRFPDSIRDVIYSGRQFPPAHNGLLDKSKPNKSALRAAKDALNGKNNVENAVYFFNPTVSKGSFWSNLDVIVKIGHHSFAN